MGNRLAPAPQWPSAGNCFLRGTPIRTLGGDVPVEALRIGERLPTLDSGPQAIRWIGRRRHDPAEVGHNPAVLPILVRRDAIAAGLPARHLLVSPRHSLCLDGWLVPAECLLNDSTVVQVRPKGCFEYLHIEFDRHEVIWAAGVLAESFVDCGSRVTFDNAHDFIRLPHPALPGARFCRPLVEDGPALERIRRRIDARAGLCAAHEEPAEQLGPLLGHLDRVDGHGIGGWGFNPVNPRVPVRLEVVVDGAVRHRLIANRFRIDLLVAGLRRGRCAFEQAFDPPLHPGAEITVRRSADHAPIATARRVETLRHAG